MVNNYISKRAGLEDAATLWLHSVFDTNAGPFENLFRIIAFAAPFTGLGLWKTLVVEIGMKLLGVSPMQLGRWLDSMISKDTVSGWFKSPPDQPPPEFKSAMERLLKKTSWKKNVGLYKQAGVWSFLRSSGGMIHAIWKALRAALVFITGTFMVANLYDLYDKVEKGVSPDLLKSINIPDKFKTEKGPEAEQTQSAPSGKQSVDTMIDELEKKYNLNT